MKSSKTHSNKPKHIFFLGLTTLVVISLSIWRVAVFTEARSMAQIRETGSSRINLYARSLRSSLEQFRHLPYVLSRDSRIHGLLNNDFDALQVNPHLEDFAYTSSTLIFILDIGGTTVATSNWRTEQDLSGYSFSYRPYFKAAKEGRSGGYYTIGSRTRQPGFFISYPVLESGKFLGAVVVKVNLELIQQMWQESGEDVIVSDAYGVLFLSSNEDWKYKSLRPLPSHTAKRLQKIQYQNLPLTTLEMERQSTEGGNILLLEGKQFFEQSLQLPKYSWRIHYLTDLKVVRDRVKIAQTVTAVFLSLLLLTLLYFRERRQKLISREEAQKAQLIGEINERLRQEIKEHQRTENNLRKTQKELIQAEKLAALGRMSAAIAHELNQPVTAIRTFVASCKIFVDRNQPQQILTNLDFISRLTERMGGITGQLKIFARSSNRQRNLVDLTEVVEKVLLFFSSQVDSEQVRIISKLPPKGEALVLSDALHLEQVLNNLLSNGLHAVKEMDTKELILVLTTTQTELIFTFEDSGKGIAEEAMDCLFDPFYTTKGIGDGLGLGLSIVYGIIQDMGGSIAAENRKEGGARFTLRLPRAVIENRKLHPKVTL